MVRREIFECVGPFREDFLTSSDAEWFFRAKEMGIQHTPEFMQPLLFRLVHQENQSRDVRTTHRELLKIVRESIRAPPYHITPAGRIRRRPGPGTGSRRDSSRPRRCGCGRPCPRRRDRPACARREASGGSRGRSSCSASAASRSSVSPARSGAAISSSRAPSHSALVRTPGKPERGVTLGLGAARCGHARPHLGAAFRGLRQHQVDGGDGRNFDAEVDAVEKRA